MRNQLQGLATFGKSVVELTSLLIINDSLSLVDSSRLITIKHMSTIKGFVIEPDNADLKLSMPKICVL